jgi:hypothetical protein
MGNSASSVTSGIKNQVDGSSNAIYPLADVTGQAILDLKSFYTHFRNGELALLAKEALRKGSTEELDAAIKEVINYVRCLNQGSHKF